MTHASDLDGARLELVVVGREALVHAHGELDMFSVARLRTLLEEAANVPRVIVDMQDVTFADCAVMRCLSIAARERAAAGRTLRVDHAHGFVRRLMDLLRLDDLRVA